MNPPTAAARPMANCVACDGEPSGKLRLVGEGAGDPCGPAYRGKAERESPENSQRDADVRVPLGEKQGERGGCEGQMDQNHG